MKTEDIIRALRLCASNDNDECKACPLDHAHQFDVECIKELKTAAAEKIEKLTNRCARYAEEIAVLHERTRWIPVTERLPKDRSNVLVVAYWHEKWGVYMGLCAPERAEWSVHVGIGDRNDIAVTHWMPLPAGPEVE